MAKKEFGKANVGELFAGNSPLQTTPAPQPDIMEQIVGVPTTSVNAKKAEKPKKVFVKVAIDPDLVAFLEDSVWENRTDKTKYINQLIRKEKEAKH